MREEIFRYLKDHLPSDVDLAIILGSGLGAFADAVQDPIIMPTTDIPFYPRSTVAGHSGVIIHGSLACKKVLIFKGRIHEYEGYSWNEATLPVHVASELGAKTICITNAAGGLHHSFFPGDLMLISDYIASPMSQANALHNHFLIERKSLFTFFYDHLPFVRDIARDAHVSLKEGTYCFVSGPTYETRAEIRLLRKMGGDAAGMSTVPELITAVGLGLKTIGISCITNTSGEVRKLVTHAEVTSIAHRTSPNFATLLHAIAERISSQ